MKRRDNPLETWQKDFENPKLAGRRLLAEALGTFFLALVASGGDIVYILSNGEVNKTAVLIAPGLMVMAVILFMGKISGAHINPAVTVGFALRRDFQWRRVPGYIIAQFVGATVAALFLFLVFGKMSTPFAAEPGQSFTIFQAFMVELAATFGLVSVILGTASKAQNVGSFSAIAVGGYIALAGLWAGPVSGASMNPARSFSSALLAFNFDFYWLFIVAPLLGSALAVVFAYILRGRGGDAVAKKAAQGTQQNSA